MNKFHPALRAEGRRAPSASIDKAALMACPQAASLLEWTTTNLTRRRRSILVTEFCHSTLINY